MHRFMLGVSLSHLLLLSSYVRLGVFPPWRSFDLIFGVGPLWAVTLLSAVSAPFLLGAAAWALDSLLRRSGNSWIRKARESTFIVLGITALVSMIYAFSVADSAVLGSLRSHLANFVYNHLFISFSIGSLTGIVLFTLCIKSTPFRKRLVWILDATLSILAFSVLFSVSTFLYLLANVDSFERRPEQPLISTPASIAEGLPKIFIILLFDDFSYSRAFYNGQVDERLPNLRGLMKKSLVFHNVRSFSGGTAKNIPTMLTGQVYTYPSYFDRQLGEVTYMADGSKVLLKNQRNLFDLARGHGYERIVIGNRLRYCSTYLKGNSYCQSYPFPYKIDPDPQTLREAILQPYFSVLPYTLITLMVKLKLSRFPVIREAMRDIIPVRRKVYALHEKVLSVLKNANCGFIYAHYPIPHSPYFRYERETKQLEYGGVYFESLQVVDIFIGEILETLERYKKLDDTLLVVVSDHNDPKETIDNRIPLIIKLPYMKHRLDYENLWTHAQFLPFFEELFKCRSFTPDAAIRIIRSIAPSQYSYPEGSK